MKPPVWLEAFHRDWQRLRGRRVEPGRIPLARDWEDLLDAAGLSGKAVDESLPDQYIVVAKVK